MQVEQEAEADDRTVLEHVLACDVERETLKADQAALENLDESSLSTYDKEENTAKLIAIQERLVHIQAEKAETKAIQILIGLGFQQKELHIASKKFSGGWRMRIAIAKVIFCEPEILMLDEPTNHLDINAVAWLEDYINCLDITVVVISHARDFLNAVVDEIIFF